MRWLKALQSALSVQHERSASKLGNVAEEGYRSTATGLANSLILIIYAKTAHILTYLKRVRSPFPTRQPVRPN